MFPLNKMVTKQLTALRAVEKFWPCRSLEQALPVTARIQNQSTPSTNNLSMSMREDSLVRVTVGHQTA